MLHDVFVVAYLSLGTTCQSRLRESSSPNKWRIITCRSLGTTCRSRLRESSSPNKCRIITYRSLGTISRFRLRGSSSSNKCQIIIYRTLGTICRSRLRGSSSPNKCRVITYRSLGTTCRSRLQGSSSPNRIPGSYLPTFGKNLSVQSSRFKQSKTNACNQQHRLFPRYSSWNARTLKFRPTGCSQTSVNNHSLLRVTSQQRANLKSVIVFAISIPVVGLMNTEDTVRCVMHMGI
jgi:hypothetical protein